MKIKHEKIPIPIYNSTVNLVLGDDMNQIVDYLEKIFPGVDLEAQRSCLATLTQFTHTDGTIKIVLSLPINSSLSTVVHESVHAAWEVLDLKGVVVTIDNDESLAYLTEYIYDKVSVIQQQQQKLQTKRKKRA